MSRLSAHIKTTEPLSSVLCAGPLIPELLGIVSEADVAKAIPQSTRPWRKKAFKLLLLPCSLGSFQGKILDVCAHRVGRALHSDRLAHCLRSVHCGILPEQAVQGFRAGQSLNKQAWDVAAQTVSQV